MFTMHVTFDGREPEPGERPYLEDCLFRAVCQMEPFQHWHPTRVRMDGTYTEKERKAGTKVVTF